MTSEALYEQNFAKNLGSILLKEKSNAVFSPFSIFLALALTSAGARNETLNEMLAALCITDTNNVQQHMAEYNKKFQTDSILKIANALHINKNMQVPQQFKDDAVSVYSAEAIQHDFYFEDPDRSRDAINQWVENKTNSLIKDLIPQGYLNNIVRLVITNAIYFKGTWKTQFKKEATQEAEFDRFGTPQKVQMMYRRNGKEDYGKNDVCSWINLPYLGDFSMWFILPNAQDEQGMDQTREFLCGSKDSLRQMLPTNNVKLSEVGIPKFKIDYDTGLNDPLKALGMKSAFEDTADLTGIGQDLYISAVLHKAFVQVDEEGTEAAAATAVIIKTRSLQISSSFVADHPFFFMIEHIPTQSIVFMGAVYDPK